MDQPAISRIPRETLAFCRYVNCGDPSQSRTCSWKSEDVKFSFVVASHIKVSVRPDSAAGERVSAGTQPCSKIGRQSPASGFPPFIIEFDEASPFGSQAWFASSLGVVDKAGDPVTVPAINPFQLTIRSAQAVGSGMAQGRRIPDFNGTEVRHTGIVGVGAIYPILIDYA